MIKSGTLKEVAIRCVDAVRTMYISLTPVLDNKV